LHPREVVGRRIRDVMGEAAYGTIRESGHRAGRRRVGW
jgi:hypothetical protein